MRLKLAAARIDPPKLQRIEVKPLTPEQARQFLEAVRGDRLEALYYVALALGLRQGEILGLRWDDIDFEAETLRVRFAMQRINGEMRLVEPKTHKSRRTMPVPKIVLQRLREHRIAQDHERLLLGDQWQEHGLVFTSLIGTPLDGCNVTHRFQRILRDNDLPRQRFHDLRHTCATFLLSQGLSPRVVMETLGQCEIGLTMNTYAHVMPALQREAADRMDELLGGEG